MYDSRKIRDFSMRYCPNLRDGVLVMTEHPIGKPEYKTCLSSHLCHADTRRVCSHTASVSMKSDADILKL
ncbi:MAG: hypothetical protein IJY37_09240 [Clostridia bacterium]|nr:hypothetical protein [Clostridia bacterium]MBP3554282.1 hypothetical protein [Clostridia bacterium]MBQ8420520.1 hypothetical protein [Clostridia bacterium]